jgi:hypothetical protein
MAKRTLKLKKLHDQLDRHVQHLKAHRAHTKNAGQMTARQDAEYQRTIKALEVAQKTLARGCGRGSLCGPDMAIPISTKLA